MRGWQKLQRIAASLLLLAGAQPGVAWGGDRLAWTGGATEVEGAAGGGLVPWALVAGLGTDDEIGGSAFATHVRTARFALTTAGAAVGWHDRLEVSYAYQSFDAGRVLPGVTLGQDVFGAKLRIAGDAVADQDRWLPQLAIGALYKRTRDFGGIPEALGARRDSGIDYYLAATKVILGGVAGHNLLLDATLNRSEANQFGLLGFGPGGAAWRLSGSAAIWLADRLLIGAEYRAKRGALGAPPEGDAHDVFVAYEPCKHVTFLAAYADLGPLAGQGIERGPYLSVSAAF